MMKIGIVGLGLIGGSLAIDLRAQGHWVIGTSRRAATCQQAIALGVVDEASSDGACLAEAEVVFLCTPLGVMEATVQQLIPHLQRDAILTDVGSVKAPVVEAIAPHWPNFVGGHPMAGKAEQGLEVAEAGLFRQRAYVLTPVAETPTDSVAVVESLAQSLGSCLYRCTPEQHDQAVAWISHLPVMVSASLIQACFEEPREVVRHLATQFASSGFRDTSRVGGGNPELGVMMARYNQQNLLRSLQAYRMQLDQYITDIEQGDWSALEARLQQTQAARPQFLSDEI
jgi:arogenate dehydrogenase (NADP+)